MPSPRTTCAAGGHARPSPEKHPGKGGIVHELVVDGGELAESMRLLNKMSKHSASSELALTFGGDELMATLVGASVSVPAKGTWPGTVTVHAGVLKVCARMAAGPTALRVTNDERLEVGGVSFSCRCSPLATVRIELPLDPTLRDILMLRDEYSDEELLAAGLLEQVQAAEQKLESHVSSAAACLKDIGDFRERIRQMVQYEVYGGP